MSEPIRSVAIIGLGFVGLPLAMAFAGKGFRVVGVDIDNKKIDALHRKESYLKDVPGDTLAQLSDEGKFTATYDFQVISQVDAIIVCVPTPLKNQQPDLSYVLSSIEFMKPHVKAGQLIVLESSTYPGTTENYILPLLEETGFAIGKDLYLGYSPERIDPGNTQINLLDIPKIVSGSTKACLEKVLELYNAVFKQTVPVSSTKAAEFVKIFENSQRMVNISFINEISLLTNKLGIDIWEAIEAAKTKPMGFHAYYPSAGIGGHCIPVDPYYLTWVGMQEGVPLNMIFQAGLINERMPHYVVGQVVAYLLGQSVQLEQAKVGIIGITYKKDVNDIRESASLKVIELLKQRRIKVLVQDDVYDGPLPEGVGSFTIEKDELSELDVTLILVDHSSTDWHTVVAGSRYVIDTRNATREIIDEKIARI